MKKLSLFSAFFILSASIAFSQSDDCNNATPVFLMCDDNDQSETGGSTSFPDAELSGTCLSAVTDVEWWAYEFDTQVFSFEFSGNGDYILFEGDNCGSLVEVTCGNQTVTIDHTNTSTYYVAVTDASDFDITMITETPANADCADAEPLSGTDSGDNFCGTASTSCGDVSSWWEVNVPNSGTTLEISVTGTIVGPMIAIFDGCGGNQVGDMLCGNTNIVDCLPAGDYWIEVSSASGDEGTIDIMETQSSSGVTGDNCVDAIDQGTLMCGAQFTFAGDNNACPEDPDPTACMQGLGGVWYTFQVAAELTTFDINGEYELFEGSCGGLTFIQDCSSVTFSGAMPGIDYFILVGSAEADFEAPPAPGGPDCNNAIDVNNQLVESTCCSPNSEFWFELDPGVDGATTIEITNISITSGFQAELFTVSCGGNAVETITSSGTFMEVSNCEAPFYVRVSSDPGGCGEAEFGQDETGCFPSGGEDCSNAIMIAQPTSNSGAASCLTGCNNICPPDAQGCGNFTQWFEVFSDIDATVMEVSVDGFDGMLIVNANTCGTALLACQAFSSGDVSTVAIGGNQSYFIGVQSDTPGDFTICVETSTEFAVCSDAELTVDRIETGGPEDGPFCLAEKVTFTYTVNFTADPLNQGNNCQWLQGIIPSVGAGWDLVACPIEIQGPGGDWDWFSEGEVLHNGNSPILNTQAGPHGLELVLGTGGLGVDDPLPGGWFITSPGAGPDCDDPNHPNGAWGMQQGCGSTSTTTFTFSLQVRDDFDPVACQDPEYLKVHMFTMADGQTGCWANNSCALDGPVTADFSIDCDGIVATEISGNRNICAGESSDLTVEAENGSSEIFVQISPDSPTDTGYEDNFDGSGTIEEEVEADCDITVVIYEAFTLTDNGCKGPVDTFLVRYLPELEFDFDQDQEICPGATTQVELNASCSLGPYTYEWGDQTTNSFIDLPLVTDVTPGNKFIPVTVTDTYGCETVQLVEYTLQEDPMLGIDGSLDLCQNGTPSIATVCAVLMNPNVNPVDFDYEWTFFPSTLVIDGSDKDQCLDIDEEQSAPGSYSLTLTGIDDADCEYDTTFQLTISGGPTLDLQIAECQGDSIKIIGINTNPAVNAALFITQFDPSTSVLMPGDTIAGPIITDTICVWTRNFTDQLQLNTSGGCTIAPLAVNLPPTSPPNIVQSDTDICEGESVTLTVMNPGSFPGGITWNDGVTTQSGSSITESPTVTTTYTFTGINLLECDVTESFMVVVNPNPVAEITGSTTFCAGESTDLTANSISGAMPFQYDWTGNSVNQTLNVVAAGTFFVTITDANGCSDITSVEVSVDSELTPSISAPAFCAGTMTTVDGGAGFDSWDWVGPNGEVESGQMFDTDIEGDWMLTVSSGSCSGTGMVTVTAVPDLPVALDSPPIMVCNEDTGTLSTRIDLSSLIMNGVDGIWTNELGNNVPDPTDVSFENASAGSLIYTFTTTSAQSPCLNSSFPLEINVQNCGCPSTTVSSPSDFCNDDLMPFDLTLNAASADPGTWSITPTDIILNGNILELDATTPPGNYELIYTLDATVDPNCNQTSAPVSFTVWEAPVAQLTNGQACDSDASGGSTVVDLDDLVLSGNTSGTWMSSDFNLGNDNVVDFTGVTPGSYSFSYSILPAPNSVCPPFTESVTVLVADCACPILAIAAIPPLCNTGGNITLGDFLNDTADPGEWSIDMGANITSPDLFSAGGVPAGTYTVTYSLFTQISGCDNSVEQQLEVFEGPEAELTESVTLCNGVDVTTFPTSLDLTSLVLSGSTGTWTADQDYIDAIGPIVDETNVDFLNVPPGVYNFIYTTNTAQSPCQDLEIPVRLDVTPCNCPTAILSDPGIICTDVGTLDLTQFITNPADVPPGEWEMGLISPTQVLISNDGVLQTQGLVSGVYSFDFNYLDSEVPISCPGSVTLNVIFEAQTFVDVLNATACNRVRNDGTHCIDLTSLALPTIQVNLIL